MAAWLLLGILLGTGAAQQVPNRVRWSVTMAMPPEGAPIVAGSALVIPLQNGTLAAHRLTDGSALWTAELKATQPLAADEDRVYVTAGDAVHALAVDTGRPVWRVTAAGPITAPLLAHAGWVIGAAAGELVVMRAADGVVVWRRPVGPVEFRPALDGDLLVVSVEDGRLVAFDLPTGAMRWEVQLGSRPAEPLVIGGRVYVGTADRVFHSLHASNGRRDWRRTAAVISGRAAVDDRHIYFAAMDNVLRALDRRHGALRWNKGLPYRPAAGPVVIGGGVVVPGYVEALPVFRTADGAPAGQIRFAAALTALPVFAARPEDGVPIVFGSLGSLLDRWTVTLLETSLVPELPVTPLTEWPGDVIPMPVPPEG